MKKIGVVGLGIMGSGIANNFLKNGYPLFVWNRTKSVVEKFSSKGATLCKSPADVVCQADIIFEVTANDQSSKIVWLGKDGILDGANKDKYLIACATLSITWTDELIKKCKKLAFKFMDMAMTGGRNGAESGNLTLLCGAKKQNVDAVRPVLSAIAKKIYHFGPEGQGMRYKLILNFLQAVHIIGYGQAMKIAKANKMNLKKVGEALSDRPGGTITYLAFRDFFKEPNPINFSVEWITKDLIYAKKMTKNLDVSLLDEVILQYKRAVKKGLSQKDWTSVNTIT